MPSGDPIVPLANPLSLFFQLTLLVNPLMCYCPPPCTSTLASLAIGNLDARFIAPTYVRWRSNGLSKFQLLKLQTVNSPSSNVFSTRATHLWNQLSERNILVVASSYNFLVSNSPITVQPWLPGHF